MNKKQNKKIIIIGLAKTFFQGVITSAQGANILAT